MDKDFAEVVRMVIGETKVIPTRSPTRVVIGKPEIADISDVTEGEIMIAGKSPGTTSLIFWDAFGEQSVQVKVFAEDIYAIEERINNLLVPLGYNKVYTKANEDEGRVLLLGTIKKATDRDRIYTAMGTLKDSITDLITVREEEAVVEIDVQVLELNKGATDTLGFTWPGSIEYKLTDVSKPITIPSNFGEVFTLNKWTRAAINLNWKLDLLIQEGKARVLSRPRMACQSGKEARLLVGGEVPVLSSTVTGGGVPGTTATPGTVEYKEYGIILNIKPTIDDNKRVNINLGVEVSELGETVSTAYALAYTFTKRNASTELWMDDGETLAIGGLIKQRSQEDLRKFPWLADLPVLGVFFRKRTTTSGGGYDKLTDSELFITLTPRIVTETKDAPPKSAEIKKVQPPAIIVDESTLDPVTRYASVIQKRILDNLNYPVAAKEAGFQGTVRLYLHLSYQGQLLEAVVKDSSGHKVLDDNAVKIAQSMPSYPPFPSTIESKDLWIEIPVTYRLN